MAVLNVYAARMSRLIADNYQATAPCTHDTLSRIHQPPKALTMVSTTAAKGWEPVKR